MSVQPTNCRDSKIANKEKIFVIGLDGATFDLIEPWAREGKLPNLAKMMKEGTYGELESTIPTNSAPAWTSFVTGTNPGKHGILHFKALGYQTKEYLMNRKSRGCKAIWNILSEYGKKVGIINVPLTYPPEEVNGFMISGMDTPSRKKIFTFPEGLYQEINKAVGDYEIEAQLADLVRIRSDTERRRFIKAVMNTLELRVRTTKYLMERHDWDYFLVVFTAADRFQHRFWKYMDNTHPHYSSKKATKYGNVISSVYKRLDEIVGELSDKLDDDTTLVIMSDHGFGPAPVKCIDLNSWLLSKGFLAFKEKQYTGNRFNLNSYILNKLQLYTPLKLRHYLRGRFRSLVDRMQLASRVDNIDWSSTKAYSDQHVEIFSTIWINLKGREIHGIVENGDEYQLLRDRIVELVKSIRDPETGEVIVKNAFKKEDLAAMSASNKLPDIVVEWKDNAYRTQNTFAFEGNSLIGTLDSKETSQTISGEHNKHGICILNGKGIKKGEKIQGAHITDLTPTILFKLGLGISKNMDGKILICAFEDDYLKSNEIKYSDTESKYENLDSHQFSQEETQVIEDRLRGLGYL